MNEDRFQAENVLADCRKALINHIDSYGAIVLRDRNLEAIKALCAINEALKEHDERTAE